MSYLLVGFYTPPYGGGKSYQEIVHAPAPRSFLKIIFSILPRDTSYQESGVEVISDWVLKLAIRARKGKNEKTNTGQLSRPQRQASKKAIQALNLRTVRQTKICNKILSLQRTFRM